jgi:hypothetical protein
MEGYVRVQESRGTGGGDDDWDIRYLESKGAGNLT